VGSHFDLNKALTAIDIHRRMAYVGRIGRRRKEFCVGYIEQKRSELEKISRKQVEQASAIGRSISCHEGCYFCCAEPIVIYLPECEAIVYFLYQNEVALTSFLQAYQSWLTEAKKYQGVLERMSDIRNQMFGTDSEQDISTSLLESLSEEAEVYTKQQILCPFLIDGRCSIYEVRPWVCAALYSTTPSEWCNPTSPNAPEAKPLLYDPLIDVTFYDERPKALYTEYLPIFVFYLLTDGLRYLSNNVPGLESLWDEILHDPEVRAVALEKGKPR